MKANLKYTLQTLILSFLAGLLISIGSIINLSLDNKVLGALFFSVGLLFIVESGFKLFTGAVGYALENKKLDNFMLIVILIGNLLGTLFSALVISLTRIGDKISTKALDLVNIKLDDSILSVLILAIFCGILIYLGVNIFKKSQNNFSKVIAIVFCVIVFILSSYEHCIANMFYFFASNTYSIKAVLYILIMVIGNSIGGLLIPTLIKIVEKLKA